MTYVNTKTHRQTTLIKNYVEHNMYVLDIIFRSVGPLGIHTHTYLLRVLNSY